MIKPKKTMTKASDIFKIHRNVNLEYYFRQFPTTYLKTREQAQFLLNKWDSVEALEAENALYREYLQEITNRVNDGEILPDKLFVKIEKALEEKHGIKSE